MLLFYVNLGQMMLPNKPNRKRYGRIEMRDTNRAIFEILYTLLQCCFLLDLYKIYLLKFLENYLQN